MLKDMRGKGKQQKTWQKKIKITGETGEEKKNNRKHRKNDGKKTFNVCTFNVIYQSLAQKQHKNSVERIRYLKRIFVYDKA